VVDEAGAVGSVDESGYLEGFAVLVEAGVQDVEHGDPGWQIECPCLVVAGHPGDDFILPGSHNVATFFKPAVDATGSSRGL
jgi:hypothetical protein